MSTDYNNSWQNITNKIKKLNQERDKLYKELDKAKKFEEFVAIRLKISKITYHLEVVETLTTESATLRNLKRLKYAEHTPKQ